MNNELIFKNILEVTSYLKTGGWKIQKSTAYRHAQEGKIRPEADGTFTEQTALKYARRFLRRTDGTPARGGEASRHDLEGRKLAAQARIAEIKAELLEGNYVEKEEFERALAKRALMFRNDLEVFCTTAAPGIINFVKGDPHLIPDLIQYMLDKVNVFLGRYADPDGVAPLPPVDIQGQIEPESDDDEEALDDEPYQKAGK